MASPTGYTAAKQPKTYGTNTAGTYEGVYNPATTYAAGDIVEYNGMFWVKTDAAAAGTAPSFASASWDEAVVKGSGHKILDPNVVGGSSGRTTLGPDAGQPSSARLANVSARTAAEA